MRLYHKSLLIISFVFGMTLLLAFALSEKIILKSYSELERKSAEDNLSRAVNAIEAELDFLNTNNIDWSAWDDTYAFVQKKNPAFLDTNMIDETFIKLRLNIIAILDDEGNIVFIKAYDLIKGKTMDVPTEFGGLLKVGQGVLRVGKENDSRTGFIMAGGAPLLISSRPIIRSNYTGPVRGTFITGRYLSPEVLALLSKKAHLDISLKALDAGSAASSSEGAGYDVTVNIIGEDDLHATAYLNDMLKRPALALTVHMGRGVYREGRRTIHYFLYGLLAVALLSATLMWILLRRFVISRLARLSGDLQVIRASGSHSDRVKPRGSDEIGQLSVSVNEMLAALESAMAERIKEREMLVKEVHHRVKNNLAVIQSLLRLQTGTTNDTKACEILLESQNRVRSMGLIHDMLYKSPDLKSISFSAYLRDVSVRLFETYRPAGSNVLISFDLDQLAMAMDMVVPAGLIVNEMVSNALKYAFPDGREGEVLIKPTAS